MNIVDSSCQSSPCSCLNLRRASQALTKLYDRYLEPSGLKISQYALVKNVNQLQPVNVSDLADALKLDRTTLVRNLRPLEEKGLVADLAPQNARDRQLVLTEEGKAKLADAHLLWQQAQCHIENQLGKKDLAIFSTLLLKIEQLAD